MTPSQAYEDSPFAYVDDDIESELRKISSSEDFKIM